MRMEDVDVQGCIKVGSGFVLHWRWVQGYTQAVPGGGGGGGGKHGILLSNSSLPGGLER